MRKLKPWTQSQMDDWNKAHPVGTKCDVRSTEYDPWYPSEIMSEGWLLGHGYPVVKVKGYSGGYCLDFIRFQKGSK